MICPLLVHASIHKKAMFEKMTVTKQSAMSIITHSITDLPRNVFCAMPHLPPEDHFDIQTAARKALQQQYHDSSVLHHREYNMLDINVESLLESRRNNEELAKDAVFHFVKSSNNTQAPLFDVINSVKDLLTSKGVDTEQTITLTAGAMNWLNSNNYIVMDRDFVRCHENYL